MNKKFSLKRNCQIVKLFEKFLSLVNLNIIVYSRNFKNINSGVRSKCITYNLKKKFLRSTFRSEVLFLSVISDLELSNLDPNFRSRIVIKIWNKEYQIWESSLVRNKKLRSWTANPWVRALFWLIPIPLLCFSRLKTQISNL